MNDDFRRAKLIQIRNEAETMSRCGEGRIREFAKDFFPGSQVHKQNARGEFKVSDANGTCLVSESNQVSTYKGLIDLAISTMYNDIPRLRQIEDATDSGGNPDLTMGVSGSIADNYTMVDFGQPSETFTKEEITTDIANAELTINTVLRELNEKYKGRQRITLKEGRVVIEIMHTWRS